MIGDLVEFNHALEQVKCAKSFADLLSVDTEADDLYKMYAKVLHPDMVDDEYKDAATIAFAELQHLWAIYTGKAEVKTISISTKKRTYALGDLICNGSIASLYAVSFEDSDGVQEAILKMPRSPKDSDLMEREAKALKKLDEVPGELRIFASQMVETFRHKDATTNETRRCNVIKPLKGFYNLAEVAEHYPNGVPPKHVAWMWRRLLVALGQAHDVGVVHGAIVPENVMIHPSMHGVVLVDWCYSCQDNQTVPALPPLRKLWYPQSVLDKEPPTFALDVSMAAKTMTWLGGAQTPTEFQAFARGCTVSKLPTPAELLVEFDELIASMWGKRRYLAFDMPERKGY